MILAIPGFKELKLNCQMSLLDTASEYLQILENVVDLIGCLNIVCLTVSHITCLSTQGPEK